MIADTNINNKSEPKNQEDYLLKLEEMYRAGVQFGYARSSAHPKMQPYIFGMRHNIEIFNLEKTHECLDRACDFLNKLGEKKGKVLFVSTKPEAKNAIEKAGRELSQSYVVERWVGGLLTNFDVVKRRILYFKELCKEKLSGNMSSKYTKKEISRLDKKFIKMERNYGGVQNMDFLPAAMVIVDSKKEKTAVREAKANKIPIVAILNSDCDPTTVDYPIPANDSSITSIEYLVAKLTACYKKGIGQQTINV